MNALVWLGLPFFGFVFWAMAACFDTSAKTNLCAQDYIDARRAAGIIVQTNDAIALRMQCEWEGLFQ